jgi:rhodanese-related sulfurtransferase
MLSFLKNIFRSKPPVNYKELLKNGAQLIDVRTPGEYKIGHLKGAVNLPLQQLQSNVSKIRKDKPVITYCASGMRSSSAKNLLVSIGFREVYNGGGFHSLENKIR